MPRKQRTPKVRHEPLTPEELARRAKWGGLLDDVPTLTASERMEWAEIREGTNTWLPQRTLRLCCETVDPLLAAPMDLARVVAAPKKTGGNCPLAGGSGPAIRD